MNAPEADFGYVTIPFAGDRNCRGGVWFVDGEVRGRYPVRRHPLRAGSYVIAVDSAGHCAGYGKLEVAISAGQEHVMQPEQFRR